MQERQSTPEIIEAEVLLRDRDAVLQLERGALSEGKRQALSRRVFRSNQILKARTEQSLSFVYPQTLPVVGAFEDLSKSIQQHQVTIVCSGTGSGKSTQIPKLCLQLGFGLVGQIGHTQPRRIAARSVAQRIASETKSELGRAIGSQVRFDKTVADQSRLKVMTDGILLEEIRNDRLLLQYDVLIIDEVHERSSNIDFVLGYVAKILPQRPDLKVILMSATVDNEPFLKLFEANLVEVPGKQFSIEFDYRPFDSKEQSELQAVDAALRTLDASDDVLVFFPGEREINDALRYLGGRGFDNTEFLPLFSRLNPQAQGKVFKLTACRRVILATNVAETSITIPGIRHVIDTGLARISRYNPRSKLLELPIAEISQAAAKQRAGRCGREAPGRCIRLYDEENFEARDEYTLPEILRTNLASSILRCEHLKLGKLEEFPLPDKPSERLIRDGVNLLKEIAALDEKGTITPAGKQLARLSVDPRLGKFLLAAAEAGQLQDAIIIVAALTAGDCRIRPADARDAASEMHDEFNHRDSDLLFFTNLWEHLQTSFGTLSVNQQRKFCARKFLSWQRIQQWQDLRTQLTNQSLALGLNIDKMDFNYKRLHTAFLVGFASLIGCKNANGEYQGARGVNFRIHPRSALSKRKPQFVACLEMYETNARYAQIVAKIDSAWVQRAAPHLIKHSYSQPQWDSGRGRAVAFETQRIFGIKLGVDKKVSYVTIDPARSRELFITHALVKNELHVSPQCISYNERYIKGLLRLEQKLRRSTAPDDDEMFQHYALRLPKDIFTEKAFSRWLQEDPSRARSLKLDDTNGTKALYQDAERAYPNSVSVGELEFDLDYLFDPVLAADGMTFIVPKPLLARLDGDAFEKLCPGLLAQKLTLVLKALPKNCRKKISPVADFVNELLAVACTDPLEEMIRNHYLNKTGEVLEPGFVKNVTLPVYLIAHVKVIDPAFGKVDGRQGKRARSRFYPSLQQAKSLELSQQLSQEPAAQSKGLPDDKALYTSWNFGELRLEKQIAIGKNRVTDYQALVDMKSGVTIKIFRSMSQATDAHLHGVARLASMSRGIKSSKRALPGLAQKDILLMCASVGLNTKDVAELHKASYASLLNSDDLPRSVKQFDRFVATMSGEAENLASRLSFDFAELVARAYRIKTKNDEVISKRWPTPAAQIGLHLSELLNGEMLSFVQPQRLAATSRYLLGVERRIERLQLDPRKDELKMTLVEEPLLLWRELYALPGRQLTQCVELRYAIEEVLLSQFAPELVSRKKVTLKQVMQQLNQQISSAQNGT